MLSACSGWKHYMWPGQKKTECSNYYAIEGYIATLCRAPTIRVWQKAWRVTEGTPLPPSFGNSNLSFNQLEQHKLEKEEGETIEQTIQLCSIYFTFASVLLSQIKQQQWLWYAECLGRSYSVPHYDQQSYSLGWTALCIFQNREHSWKSL